MRVAFYTPYPLEGPSSRFRVYQFIPYLRAHGVFAEIFPFLHSQSYRRIFLAEAGRPAARIFAYLASAARRMAEVEKARRFDLAFVHLNVSPLAANFFARRLARCGTPVVFDFDDAQFLRYSSAVSKFSDWLKSTEQTAGLLRLSRHAIAGNRYLAGYAQQFCREVSVIPTCIDTEAVKFSAPRQKPRLVIGWMGSSASTRYLKTIESALHEILRRHQNVEVHVVGARGFPSSHERMKLLPWSLDTEESLLRTFDIGLMPLSDEEYSRGKCGFKALQYMSVGVPVVVSPVGVNTEIVQEGANGFHASTGREWVEKISGLIENAELRRQFGQCGRETVEKAYSVRVHAPRLLKILESAAS